MPYKTSAQKMMGCQKTNPETNVTELESEIDQLVYELYGLSVEEIGVVEGII